MSEKEGLSRARLVSEALGLVQEEGLEALSMRGLADRLEVKAASLYWHVRDRRELLELLAESILERARTSRGRSGWRSAVSDAAAALQEAVARQKDADRILLEVPDALEPRERADVVVEIVDPGKTAEGFEIDVCARMADGRIACANDDPAQLK